MGRFKIKKQDTFIDMTPMSDVMVLLLTFFMLTAKTNQLKLILRVLYQKSKSQIITFSPSLWRKTERCS